MSGTSGTVRTPTYLLTTEFQDGQPPGSVSPQDLRDFIVSWENSLDPIYPTNTTNFPAIIRGTVDVGRYPGVTMGAGQTGTVRTATGVAIQAACDFAVANNKFIEFRPATYEINNAAGIVWAGANYLANPPEIHGVKGSSNIIQFASNAPVATWGPTTGTSFMQGGAIKGLTLDYGVTQTSQTAASTLTIGACWAGRIEDIQIGTGGFAPYNALNLAGGTGGSSVFSMVFSNLTCQLSQNALLNSTANGSGNVFTNCYFNNFSGSTATAITQAFMFNPATSGQTFSESVFDQCNIEWCATSVLMNLTALSATFTALHVEGNNLTGAAPNLINLNGPAFINIIGPTFLNNCMNTSVTSGTPIMFYCFDDSQIRIQGGQWVMSDPALSLNIGFQMAGSSGSGWNVGHAQDPLIELDGMYFNSVNGFMSLESLMPRATYGDLETVDGYQAAVVYPRTRRTTIYDPITAGNYTLFGACGSITTIAVLSPLTSARTITLSDKMMSTGSGSTLKRTVGDQCVIRRATAATGAFNITVTNGGTGGGTIGTFTGGGSAGTSQTFGFDGTNWASI